MPLPDGVYAACLTPQHPDFRIDHPRLAVHAAWLLQSGCTGLTLMGTTGEAVSFSVDERREMLEHVLAAGVPASSILLGVGCSALTDTLALARHAVDHGVRSLLVLPPFYYKHVRDDGLVATFDALVQHIGGEVNLFLYHFPALSGVPFTLPLIERLVGRHPGIVTGIKDSSGDVGNMRAVAEAFPGFRVFAGTEKYLLEVLRAGGAGCISATANLTAPWAARLFLSWQNPGADALQAQLTAVRQAIEVFPAIPALKYLTERRTGDVAWRHMRPPIVPLSPDEQAALWQSVQRIAPELVAAA
jgi:4-hydroxy-tetrahydrodipicolinate synthase